MDSSPPPELDPYVEAVSSRGYNPENLPALRQYLVTKESGNMEAAKRIGDNLLAFLAENDPT